MGAMRTYVVRQEREVKVRAENPCDAARLGTAFFAGEDGEKGLISVPGHTVSDIRETEISAREDY